ncbi:hypothetical protein HRI_002645600 [Hibiscus trionum]|uniref:DRBM domain-containing protein n=1 Tax=Hibiscus trionum TaxID=183268 RepID=A0A9W7M6G4_HIBTR|nr:hypothetical protein HRI_002645600 [Hibiscus trionum]
MAGVEANQSMFLSVMAMTNLVCKNNRKHLSKHEQIGQFSEEIQRYPLHSNGLIEVPKALADLVETTIGAVFIDTNFSIDLVWKVFKDLLEPIIRQETLKIHPVTQLYEVCQKRNLKVKFVDLWKENTGFDVFVDDQLVGRGKCSLKKEIAHNRAAKDALDNILRILDQKHTHSNTDEGRTIKPKVEHYS